jgi:hypothetical protein
LGKGSHGSVLSENYQPNRLSSGRKSTFHPQEVAEGGAGGRLTIRIHAFGHLKMAWHFYHWGDAVEELAPQYQGK